MTRSLFFKDHNKKIVIGAADTFRAAAIDQLKVWCDKNNTEMIQSEVGSDPASVAFKTLEYAKNNNMEIISFSGFEKDNPLSKKGDINFGLSEIEKDSCKIYLIETELELREYNLKVENCAKTATILSIRVSD